MEVYISTSFKNKNDVINVVKGMSDTNKENFWCPKVWRLDWDKNIGITILERQNMKIIK